MKRTCYIILYFLSLFSVLKAISLICFCCVIVTSILIWQKQGQPPPANVSAPPLGDEASEESLSQQRARQQPLADKNAPWHPRTRQAFDSTIANDRQSETTYQDDQSEHDSSSVAEVKQQVIDLKPYGSIALILDDVGGNKNQARRALELPASVTLSFLPYASGLDGLLDQANKNGHDIMLHLPMQPQDSAHDPGPNALRADHSRQKIHQIININLEKFNQYRNLITAVNNHMGSEFMTNPEQVHTLIDYLDKRDLRFIDSVTVHDSKAQSISEKLGLTYLARDFYLDNNPIESDIKEQWRKAMALSQKKRVVVVIAHPYPESLRLIPGLIRRAQQNEIPVISISKVFQNAQSK